MPSITLPLSGLKGWIIGLTSILVVLPALINAASDVYVRILDLPRSDAERSNARLFEKYFNKHPVTTLPLAIRHTAGTVDALISVYEGGDVLVEYGKQAQWFPFPLVKGLENSFFIRGAFAQEFSARGIGTYKQEDRSEGRVLVRERKFDNGTVEEMRIDTRTGEILERKVKPAAAGSGGEPRQVAPFGVIDVGVQGPVSGAALAARCVVPPQGSCTLVRRVAKGAQCFCATTAGTLAGHAQ